MRFKNIILGFFFILAFANIQAFGQNETPKRYHVQSGHIQYQSTGAVNGIKTIYFTHWGLRESIHKKVVAMVEFGDAYVDTEQNTLDILDKTWIYSINLNLASGSKYKTEMAEIYNKKMDVTLTDEVIKDSGAKKIGKEKILGKKCTIWEDEGQKFWVWKGLILKSEYDIAGEPVSEVAEIIEIDIEVNEAYLTPPSNVKIDNQQELEQLMALNKLKDIDAIALPANTPMRYHVQSAHIEYKTTGAKEGRKEIYFKDWGFRESTLRDFTATKSTGRMLHFDNNDLSILDQTKAYSINLKLGAGSVFRSGLQEAFAKNADLTLTDEALVNSGAKKIGHEKILDKPCTIWETEGEKFWIWKGLTLKNESFLDGELVTEKAIVLEIDINIDEKHLVPPPNIIIDNSTGVNSKKMLYKKTE